MKKEEIMALNMEALEQRASEIATETAGADSETLDALNEELDWIAERRANIMAEVEVRNRAASAVAGGAGRAIRQIGEVRDSAEYIEAFANFVKTGSDVECRALLTTNVDGGMVPVPSFIEEKIRTAWENDEIFARVSKSFVRGNLKVGFEVSSTEAAVHTEGNAAPSEEELVLGLVTLVAKNIKKWIKVSDEVLEMGAEDFLSYIYDELTYRIVKKAADEVISKIENAPETSTTEKVGVPVIETNDLIGSVLDLEALLTGDITELVVIANRSTIAAMKKEILQAHYQIDPFDGATIIYTDKLQNYATADIGATFMIAGDLKAVQANMPAGANVTFKFDDLTYAEDDLVKIVGKMLTAIEVVGPGQLARAITKE